MKKVFISYRRDDTQAIAGRLYDGLSSRLGEGSVFFDIDSIPLGSDFREHVKATLDQCGVLLALIGPKWLETTRDGRRRLDDPNDLVRVEVEIALERRIPVVPVLIDHTPMPGAGQLPGALSALAYRNAVRVDSGIDFWNHLARLIAGITPHLDAGATTDDEAAAAPAPVSTTARPLPASAASRRPWIVAAFAALALLLVYTVLSFRLAGAVDQVDASMQTLAFAPPASAPAPTTPARLADLSSLLRPEIDSGLLKVIVLPGRGTVRMQSDRLFASGSAAVEAAAAPMLKRVARALRDLPGQVVVAGHTDDVQIRTVRFPSNFHLSDERARAVAALLVDDGVAAVRLRAEGRADGDALAPNDTPANRALNRRIEVTIYEPFMLTRPAAAEGGS